MGVIMLIEAVIIIGGIKFLGAGPKSADAAAGAVDAHDEHGGDAHGDAHGDGHGGGGGGAPGGSKDKKIVELQLIEMRAPNKVSGRTLIFDVSIFVSLKGDREEAVKTTIAARKALITDRIRTIIAQSDPEKLGGGSEPGLETLRRQIKHQLDEILEKGTIDEVLVPRCIPFRADY
ncbi:hypothetical protein [Humisphaera borealis]|uniref:Flagellar protein FliL n=1 Tax=Humisphaera borealis TaxID=2807512 RepID=A0A7M2X1J3_9BACT|nr:hypothetical protein [Humisphaera borealis]QOV91618.1 hypothetical protein IPV69_09750 [Humisphaera borealis]